MGESEIMQKWIMEQGKRYKITVSEAGALVGEFRGAAGIPEWEDFIIFWVDGETAGTLIYVGDIETVKEILN